MSDEDPDKSETDAAPKRRRRRRIPWPVHMGIWSLLAIALVALFLLLASMSLTGRVVTLPGWITNTVTAQINTRMPAGRVELGQIDFAMSPEGKPRLHFVNVGLWDAGGSQVAQLNLVEGGLRAWPLVQGRIEPTALSLSGAQVTLRRRADGVFDLSFGAVGQASGDLPGVLDAIEAALAAGPLAGLDMITADTLTITLEDARSGRLWQVTDGRLKLEQSETVMDITVAFDVFNQTEELAETVFGFRSDKASSAASFGATFRNAAARDIAAQSPVLSFLSVVDAPISGALRTTFDAEGALVELAGALEMGAGALSPSAGAKPVGFDGAKLYLDYKPGMDRVDITELSIQSDWGEIRGEGHALLRDYVGGWPATLLAQVRINAASLNPDGQYAEPVTIDRGAADFRVRLDPFTVELGQVLLQSGERKFRASGRIAAGRDGWSVALDSHVHEIDRDRVLLLWPIELASKAREWIARSVNLGTAFDARASLRAYPGQEPRFRVGVNFRDAEVRVIDQLPPLTGASGYLTIEDHVLTVVAESARMTAKQGGAVEAAGTVFRVLDIRVKPGWAELELVAKGPVPAALSLLDGPPFEIFRYSDLGPDLATGQAEITGDFAFRLAPKIDIEDVDYTVTGQLHDVESDKIIPGKVLRAETLGFTATPDRFEIGGAGHIGAVAVNGSWRQRMGPAHRGHSRAEGTIELSETFLDEFRIGLPEGSVSGSGLGQVAVVFAPDAPPQFTLNSDLDRIGLRIGDLGWAKPANRTGRLEVAGQLGPVPAIDALTIEADGLSATGRVELTGEGGLKRAHFDRVRLGGWLDAPVVLEGRGPGLSPAVTVTGGTADLRRATFSSGSGSGDDAPLGLSLDRLTIAEGIRLTAFAADLSRKGGLNGTFTALVDGGAPIRGTVVQQKNGSAFRVTSPDAGGVLRDASVFESARGGSFELILAPLKGEGVYEGKLVIRNTHLVDAPAMAELLSAVSVIGLLEQLDGGGIGFSEVDGHFRLSPDAVTLYKGVAVGPSMGITLDGHYDLRSSQMDMQGVISPLYMVNAVGQVVSRRGEGLFGFSFRLKGTRDAPKVNVNPLSILTPGAFREIFRRPPPKRDGDEDGTGTDADKKKKKLPPQNGGAER